MKKIALVTVFLISLSASAQNDAVEDTIARPAITETGKPDGTKKEMKIGKDGGSLVSSDGKVALIIPEGAVSKKTTFSIQPITNMVPNGNGQAYRLEPSGIQFQKPVQLVFYYTPEESADSAQLLMGIAMQDKTGQWFSLKKFVLDTVAKTMTGGINHFSDWSKFDRLKLYPAYARLKVKKSMNLEIDLVSSEDESNELTQLSPDTELSPLTKRKIPWRAIWMANEITNGNATEGKIAVTSRTSITYTAPASLPPKNPVAVTATLLGIVYRYKGITFEKLRLVSNILIYDNAYEVTMITSLTANSGSTLGNVTYNDLGSFVVSITGKEGKLIEKANRNLPDKLDYNGQCTIKHLRPGQGNIHIKGVVSIKVIPAASPDANPWIEIIFLRTPTIFPLLQFTCPDGNRKTFTSTNEKANVVAAGIMAAFPQQVKFEAKDEEQVILKIGEEGDDMYAKFSVKQIKEE
jgi:hypothetical protein